MKLQGRFIVSDTWQGANKDTGEMRASATLTDAEKGGEFRLNFPKAEVPSQFVPGDELSGTLIVQPKSTKVGLMLTFFGFVKEPVTGSK